MHARIPSAALLALAASLVSAGNVVVDNLCTFNLYLNSNPNSDAPSAPVTLAASTEAAYTEVERGPDPAITNNAIRIDTESDFAEPLIFTYNQDAASGYTYYALSTIFGDPLLAQGFEVVTDGGHAVVACPPRTGGDCPGTYSPSNPNGNNAVYAVPNGSNFNLKLCKSD
ncbi:hypothetical protein F5B20DRAFT_498850 [Whalleya microplaca]|nr:hypothetical protein F5B20DRAFT_498850 [Whalleya microplaca]